MFNSARLKLTAWYLLIIMTISVCFSLAIYFNLSRELDSNYQRLYHRYQIRSDFIPDDSPAPLPPIDQGFIDASKEHIGLTLLFTNLLILVVSTSAGYFLAGRTLKPIKDSLDEQNRFVADASHELRTPLTALRTSIEVNLRDGAMTKEQADGWRKGSGKTR